MLEDIIRPEVWSKLLCSLVWGLYEKQPPHHSPFQRLLRKGMKVGIVIERAPASLNSLRAQSYGEVRASMEKTGNIIGPLDFLIAAHALSLKSILVTNNVSEFKRVKSLKVEDWTV